MVSCNFFQNKDFKPFYNCFLYFVVKLGGSFSKKNIFLLFLLFNIFLYRYIVFTDHLTTNNIFLWYY
ncbi:hypothetical protein A2U11_10190 [Fusobacterium necrophorum subsp. funduliforme]|nr:hypothetical protein A2U11_10190 [Fusobacterium necrophorum subsp. funduliforme]